MSVRPISKGGGSRQRIWNTLRKAKQPISVSKIADLVECAVQTAQGYLAGLKGHGYAENTDEGWSLIRNTGPRSPSINVNTGSFHDWNLAKAMTAKELKHIWKASGLSLSQFSAALGQSAANGDRIKHMISGQRPVSPMIEAAAEKLKTKITR